MFEKVKLEALIICWNVFIQPFSPYQAHEGQNYLGLGVIILLLLTVLLKRKSLKQINLRNHYLIIVFILLFCFALSNKIYAGKTLLWEYPRFLSEWAGIFGERFRATGRFFWPVGYGLTFLKPGTVHLFLSATYKNPISLEEVKHWVGSSTRKWCRYFPLGIICIPEPDERDLKILNHRYFSKIPKNY